MDFRGWVGRVTGVVALSVLLGASPALAGWAPLELLAAGQVGTTGQGGAIAVGGLKELTVYLSCTASSGTGETLDVYLQSSSDNGVTWFDLPFELGQTTNVSAAETAATINKRDFFELAADILCTTTGKASAKYVVFGNYVRVAYVISGTSPLYTFGVKAIGKN